MNMFIPRCAQVAVFLLQCAFVISEVKLAANTIHGYVPPGNYTRYKVTLPGHLLLLLHTVHGDADLYVSSVHQVPTYNLDRHEMQSTTCGLDSIEIGRFIPRPLYIAVYGHPATNEESEFQLRLLLNTGSAQKSTTNSDDYDYDYDSTARLEDERFDLATLSSYYDELHFDVNDPVRGRKVEERLEKSSFLELLFSLITFLVEIVFEIMV